MKSIVIPTVLCLAACAPSPGPIKRQMVGLLEKFDRWDYNGDGYLVKSELKDAALLNKFTEQEIIDFYDVSRDGRISLTEAQAAILREPEAREIAKEIEAKP